jgi:hypothetical protein
VLWKWVSALPLFPRGTTIGGAPRALATPAYMIAVVGPSVRHLHRMDIAVVYRRRHAKRPDANSVGTFQAVAG